MSGLLSLRRLVSIMAIIVIWTGLWGTISIANILSGLLVGIIATTGQVASPFEGGLRIGSALKFGYLVAVDLVQSTVSVAREVLTITDYTDESIVAVSLPAETANHFVLLTVAITLTPGTAVVEADKENAILYLHLLHNDRAEDTIAHVEELAAAANSALPVDQKGLRW